MLKALPVNRNRSRLVSGVAKRLGGQSRYDYGGVAENNLRGSRMSIGFDLPEMTADWTPVYYQAERRTNRVDRLQARAAYEQERTVPLVSRGGMQGTLFLMIFGLAMALIFIVVGANASDVRAASRRVSSIETRIADVDRQCEALRDQYEVKAASVDVGYAAVDLGMISSRGVSMVLLYAPDDAMMTPYGTSAATSLRYSAGTN